MRRRYIYIPSTNKWITLGAYVKGVKRAKQHIGSTFDHGITCWAPCTGAEIVKQFLDGVEDRINQATPYVMRGTKE